MANYHEVYSFLIIATTVTGLYFPTIEKVCGSKWYIKSMKALFIFPGVGMPTLVLFALKFVLWDEANIVKKVYGFVLCLYASFSTFTVYSYYYYKKDIVAAFELWDSMFQEELYPEDRQALLTKNWRITNRWFKGFGGFSFLSVFFYALLQFLNPEKKLDHPSGVPYRHQSPDFELVVTYEFILGIYGYAMMTCFDSIILVLMSLEEAQVAHLKRSLSRIIGTLSVSHSGELHIGTDPNPKGCDEGLLNPKSKWVVKESFSEIDKKLRIWIKHHDQVLRFHEELFKIFNFIFSVKFMVLIILICLCSFLIVSEGGFSTKDALFAVSFCISNYTLFYRAIQFADFIKDGSNGIFEDAFGMGWHFYPEKFKTVFKIILLRSQRPVVFKPLQVYPLSSRSFLKILSSGYSVFTFLLHISNKQK